MSAHICEKCGAENRVGASFCSSCGTSLPLIENLDKDKFKYYAGNPPECLKRLFYLRYIISIFGIILLPFTCIAVLILPGWLHGSLPAAGFAGFFEIIVLVIISAILKKIGGRSRSGITYRISFSL